MAKRYESTLYDDPREFDFTKLTEKQQQVLMRQGQSSLSQGSGSEQNLGQSATSTRTNQIMSEAGAQMVTSGNNILVPNTQRANAQRADERTQGGVRGLTSSPPTFTPPGMPSRGANPSIPSAGLGSSLLFSLAKKGLGRGIKKLLEDPVSADATSAADLQVMADKNTAANTGQVGQSDVAGLAKALASRPPDLAQMSADPLIGPQSFAEPDFSGMSFADEFASPDFGSNMLSGSAGGTAGGLGGFAGTGIAQAAGGGATAAGTGLSTGGVVGQTIGTGVSSGTGFASTALGLAGSAASILAPMAAVYIGSKILEGGLMQGKDPKGIGGMDILRISEGKTPSESVQGKYVIETDEETGQRRMLDKVASSRPGSGEVWYNLDDPEFLDSIRKAQAGQMGNPSGRAETEQQGQMLSMKPMGGDSGGDFYNKTLASQQSAYKGLQDFKNSGYSGLSSDELMSQGNKLTQAYTQSMDPYAEMNRKH